jgi:hypothetical protein
MMSDPKESSEKLNQGNKPDYTSMEETKVDDRSNNSPQREQENIIFGLSIKKGFNRMNVIGLFLLEFGSVAYVTDTNPL